MIPTWIKETLEGLVPELLAEFIGVQSIKKLLQKGKVEADTKAKEATSGTGDRAESKNAEIKHEGLFNLSDEEAYFKLISALPKKDATKISYFLTTFLAPWQQRRFRASVGNLGEVTLPAKSSWQTLKKTDVTKKYPLRRGDAAAGEDNRTEYEQKEIKSGGETINLGVKFLQSFAKCDEMEMLDICEASGIMHSDLEAVKQAWKKITSWVESQGPALVKSINSITGQLEVRAGAGKGEKPPRPYRGFFRELISFKK